MIPLKDDNPTRTVPFVTWALLAASALTFLWQLTLAPEARVVAVYALGVTPAVLSGALTLPPEAQWVSPGTTLFTSMFLHGGLLHLGGNLLYLWVFGDNVEDDLGHLRFVLFYAFCGVVAALAQALPDLQSEVPMIGASGAISGVLGAYLLLYPAARVTVLIPIPFFVHLVRLPAVVVLLLWFAVQLLSSLMAPEGAGVAFRAHVGGFVAGLLSVWVFRPARRA